MSTDGHDEHRENDPNELLEQMPAPVRAEADALLRNPNLLGQVIDDVASCGVAGERDLIATIYLIGTSRLLPDPLGAIVQSPTSTGKSYVVDRTADLFPPESIIRATAITAQALYYMADGSLSHRFIVAGERSRSHDDNAADATKALRELLSSGRLSKLVTEAKGNRLTTRYIEQSGPISYIESTTAPNIFAEDANRCLRLATTATSEQTRAILQRIADESPQALATKTIQKHHALQRILQQKTIKIPFGSRLADLFPADRPEARRAFGQLLSMVRAVALLHQLQRESDADANIIADISDYAVARRLLIQPLGRSIGGQISCGAIRFFERLKSEFGGSVFSTTDAVTKARLVRQTVNDYLWELATAGALSQVAKSAGCKAATWQIDDTDWNQQSSCEILLPSASAVADECQTPEDLTQNSSAPLETSTSEAVSGGVRDTGKAVPPYVDIEF